MKSLFWKRRSPQRRREIESGKHESRPRREGESSKAKAKVKGASSSIQHGPRSCPISQLPSAICLISDLQFPLRVSAPLRFLRIVPCSALTKAAWRSASRRTPKRQSTSTRLEQSRLRLFSPPFCLSPFSFCLGRPGAGPGFIFQLPTVPGLWDSPPSVPRASIAQMDRAAVS